MFNTESSCFVGLEPSFSPCFALPACAVLQAQRTTSNLMPFAHPSLADCPNPRCSETIVLDAEPAPDSPLVCPACDTKLCAWCNTIWHKGFSCKEYQVQG